MVASHLAMNAAEIWFVARSAAVDGVIVPETRLSLSTVDRDGEIVTLPATRPDEIRMNSLSLLASSVCSRVLAFLRSSLSSDYCYCSMEINTFLCSAHSRALSGASAGLRCMGAIDAAALGPFKK